MRLVLSLCFAVLVTASSAARHMNSPEAPCRKEAITSELYACFDTAYKANDRELNRIYASVRTVLDEEDFAKLQSAQRLWLQFRDSSCTAERDLYTGGTAAPVAYIACMEELTRQRVKELQTIYDWRIEKFSK